MELTKKQEAEVTKVYDTWLNSYLNGDVKTYDSYLDKDYHFIGSTDNEDFLTRKETTKFFKTTAEQLAGKCQIKNNIRIIEKFDELVFITERFDANFLIGKKWVYYGKFRFSSVMHKKAEGWRFIYQHFSLPDSKADAGETLGAEQVSKENQELRDAIKRRTAELEIKNRELEIETSLEKVRAVAMGMHKPDDMLGVCKILYQELKSLGFTELRNAMIHSFPEGKDYFINYDYSASANEQIAQIPCKGNPQMEKFIKAIRKSENAFQHLAITGKQLKEWIAFRKKNNELNDPQLNKTTSLNYYNYAVGAAGIGISTYGPIKKEKQELLQRFRNVFQLAYQRYTDIKLAEAQVKEAKIEASLERVRSRSLAMHNTSELQEVIHTVHEELLNLNIAINGGSFIAINSDIETTLRCWGSGGTADTTEEINIPLYKKPFCTNLINKIKKGPGFFIEAFTQKDKKDFFTFLFKHQPWSKLKAKQKNETLSSTGGYTRSCFVSKHTSIFIINHLGEIFSADDNEILQRFGKVFEQSYTRFLDLQKAEAQTREAQIELGLERVRARAMAMQHPNDLHKVNKEILIQLNLLQIQGLSGVTFYLIDGHGWVRAWDFSSPGNIGDQSSFTLEFDFNKYEMLGFPFKTLLQTNLDYFVADYPLEKLKRAVSEIEEINPAIAKIVQEALSTGILTHQWTACSRISNGMIGIDLVKPPNEDTKTIVLKMAGAFNQAYVRFLDLQKAEAQTREAEIELALERVRARTMAMQKSEELAETAVLLFHQLKSLGLDIRGCGFNIWEKNEKTCTAWMSGPDGTLSSPFNLPLTEDPFFIRYYESRQHGEDFWVYETSKDELAARYQYLRTLPDLGKLLANEQVDGMESELPPLVVDHIINFSNGNLIFVTYNHDADELDIFKRFGKVFEQTYTRFLDLQKAEASAREAQIEAALEKVRSRSMGMQKSEELKEVIQVVYDEFVQLKINVEHTGFIIDYKTNDDMHIWLADRHKVPAEISIPYFDSPHWNSFVDAKENGKDFFANLLNFEEKNKFYTDLFELIPGLPEEIKEYYLGCKALAISTVLIDNVGLYIENFTGTVYTDEENKILMRFGKVFQQTYTRFLDLQKAEAQAREAQIEAALEKVRSRSLAMHTSNELNEVVSILFEKIKELQIPATAVGIAINIEGSKDLNAYVCGENDNRLVITNYRLAYFKNKISNDIYNALAKQLDFFVGHYSKKEKDAFYKYLLEHTAEFKDLPKDILHMIFESQSYTITLVAVKNAVFNINDFEGKILAEKDVDIIKRFAKVFDQTYTRFLDLQKAESQSRENQIQLALERARTQSMIMQHSNELDDTLRVFHEQVLLLGINSAFSFLWLPDEDKSNHIFWAAWQEHKNDSTTFKSKAITYPLDRSEPATAQCLVDWRSGEPVHSYAVKPAEVDNYFTAWAELLDGVEKLKPEFFRKGLYYVEAFMKYGCFGVMLENDLSGEEKNILYRFSVEFERTYTRFLDLQKAEAQAREAEIELALERVRARTMAMQHSEELADASFLLDQQVRALGIKTWGCAFNIYGEKESTEWFSNEMGTMQTYKTPREKVFLDYYEAGQKGETLLIKEFSGKACVDWYNYLCSLPGIGDDLKQMKARGGSFPTRQIDHVSFFKYGYLLFISFEPVPEAHDIFKRFAKVFEQTYTRFLDLQKAEAQTREAQIEMALEKVRSRTMAMQRSDELSGTAALLFQEFKKLEQLELIQTTIGIYNEEKNEIEFRATDWTGSGEQVNKPSYGSMDEPTLLKPAVTAWRAHARSVVIELTGEALEKWTNYRNKMTGTAIATKFDGGRRIVSIAFFSKGHLSMSSPLPIPPEAVKTLERFAAVFDGTYTRFLDLQKAEAQARESKVEAGLERVRSRTLAMQKSDELADTSIVIFEQLITLGIEPNRLFIGIIKEKTQSIEAWATNEDGTKIDNHFTLNTDKNKSVKKMYEGWKKKKKSLTIDMTGTELQNYFHYLAVEMQIPFKDGLSQKRRVQTIAYFGQGLIGMASPDEQPKETTRLLERFAAVFNLTYTRFNDLKIAEAHAIQAEEDLILLQTEKKKAEDALVNLQAAQKQLVQSEKMASLGELTAGIAHEIQNPLNFVNNFSEVSKELLDEMKEELDKGNLDDVKEIMKDVTQNLEKINHHGKRADGIVKGMLQHSQSSTGKKEPTDINALCDEYLRLSYHGLRAKDKSFNATIKTDFDTSLEKVNVIPQDIGRVILNLITNAFYVVNEKKKSPHPLKEGEKPYEPIVTIATKRLSSPLAGGDGGKLEIKVSDNGNGIPQKVLDKIFQPFFTTKPTGQGTGLGLSLAFDIVTKGHAGELKVETKEGEGTEFIILLPV